IICDGYEVTLSVWTIVNSELFRTYGSMASLVLLNTRDLPKCLPLFTEPLFGERIIEAMQLEGCVVLQLPGIHELRRVLEDFTAIGGEHFAIDPTVKENSPRDTQRCGSARTLLGLIAQQHS